MDETQTITLTEFLAARIDSLQLRADTLRTMGAALRQQGMDSAADYLDETADLLIAECEAKRRIVERHTIDCYPGDEGDEYVCDHCRAEGYRVDDVLCPDLLDLASVYADRPGWRKEWRP